MSLLTKLWNAVMPSRLNEDVRQEMETHLALLEEEERKHGRSIPEARLEARLRFGNPSGHRERTRLESVNTWMDSAAMELRVASRSLKKAPGFTSNAVLLLALGIGVNAAIFTLVDSVIVRALPLPRPEQLVVIFEKTKGGATRPPSWLDGKDIRAQSRVFESIGTFQNSGSFLVRSGGATRRFEGRYVTPDYFSTLGVVPVLGRTFSSSEATGVIDDAVVIREDFWHTTLNGDPGILEKTIEVNGKKCRIVGILPERFRFPSAAAVIWAPLSPRGQELNRGWHAFPLVARLRPGVGLRQAQADVDDIMRRLGHDYPDQDGNSLGSVQDFRQWTIGDDIGHRLLILQLAALALFAMACANVSGLMLARYSSRQREFAIRAALGASRLRQAGQHLTESLLLTTLGCIAATAVAWGGVHFLLWLYADRLPRAAEVTSDWKLVSVTIAIALAGATAIGLAGAFHTGHGEMARSIRESNRVTADQRSSFVRRALVVLQVACAVTLLGGAGELLQSMWTLLHVNAGLDRAHLLTMRVELPANQYRKPDQIVNFYAQAAADLETIPGVTSAAAINLLPVEEFGFNGDVNVKEQPAHSRDFYAEYRWVTADLLKTLHVPLVRGRWFLAEEMKAPGRTAVINETMARRLWGKANPLGEHVSCFSPDWITVVGVSRDVRQSGVDQASAPEVYFPANNYPVAFTSWALMVRSTLSADALVPSIRKKIESIDSGAAVFKVRTMDEVITESVSYEHVVMMLLICFSALALGLAALGLYGLVSYTVGQRTSEMAIRLALGAVPFDLVKIVAAQGLSVIAVGLAIGGLLSFFTGRLLAGLLFGLNGLNLLAFAGVTILLLLTGVVASMRPAFRVMRIQPMRALREE